MKKLNLALVAAFLAVGLSAEAQTANANYPEIQTAPAYVADTGAANVLAASIGSCPAALTNGMLIRVLPANANTTTTPTFNLCGLGAKTITKFGTSAVAANDLLTTAIAVLIYDGTRWQLQDPATLSTGSGASQALSNLSSVSINVALIPQTAIDLGASGTPFRNAYFYGQGTFGTGSFKLDGTPTAARVVTFPDNTGTVAELGLAQTWSAAQTFSVAPILPVVTSYAGLTTAGLGLTTVLGVSDVTAQSASQTTVNLLASTPAAGHYLVRLYVDQNALCTTGTGSVFATISWTDATHAHTAQTVPLTLANTAVSTPAGYIDAAVPLWAASASAISYTTTYAACATGTGTYDLHAEVERTN